MISWKQRKHMRKQNCKEERSKVCKVKFQRCKVCHLTILENPHIVTEPQEMIDFLHDHELVECSITCATCRKEVYDL